MTMRVSTIVTHLRPEEAHTLIEFIDQLRDMLMQTYGGAITDMLRQAQTRWEPDGVDDDDGKPF